MLRLRRATGVRRNDGDSSCAELSPRLSLHRIKQRHEGQQHPTQSIGELEATEGFTRKSKMLKRRFPISKPPYAALWKSSICRIQLVSGFHLGQIWTTISKSLILND